VSLAGELRAEAASLGGLSARGRLTRFDTQSVEGALALAAPDASLVAEDSGDVWVRIAGHAMRCCGEPSPLVEHGTGPSGELALTIRDCTPDPCDCAPSRRVDFVEHHYLGRRPHGAVTRVRMGTFRLDVTVP